MTEARSRIPWRKAVSAAIVLLLLLEAGLLLFGLPADTEEPGQAVERPLDRLLVPDPYVIRRTIPHLTSDDPDNPFPSVRTNALGFRGGELTAVPEGNATRIFCLGGSELFGATSFTGDILPEEATYAGRLQAALSERGGDWEVINAGMIGQTSLQGVRLLGRDVLPHHPDVVVVSYVWNDIAPAQNSRPDSDHKIQPALLFSVRQWLGEHVRTLRLIRSLRLERQTYVDRAATNVESETPAPVIRRVDPQAFAENMRTLIERSTRGGAMVVVLVPPIGPVDAVAEHAGPATGIQQLHARYTDIARRVADAWRVPLVDGQTLIGGQPTFFDNAQVLDVIHFNAEGHRRIGEALADVIWPAMATEESPASG